MEVRSARCSLPLGAHWRGVSERKKCLRSCREPNTGRPTHIKLSLCYCTVE